MTTPSGPESLGPEWMQVVKRTPLLCDIEAGAEAQLTAAARGRSLADREFLYRQGDPGDSLFLVLDGRVSVRAVRRGDDGESELRVAVRGDSVGEEAFFSGLSRRADARAEGPARVAEIPIAVLRRALARSRKAEHGPGFPAPDDQTQRARRTLARAAARDLIAVHALTRDLADADRDMIVDAAHFEDIARGTRLFSAGDAAGDCFLLLDGLVQLQAEDQAGELHTRAVAYLTGGDMLGEGELGEHERRALTAVAMGPTHVLRVPAPVVRAVYDRNPGLLERAGRMRAARHEAQAQAMEQASANSTRHVFRDLYRMQVARSLLVIDQDTCVRCGHCAWSCAEVHGLSRLTRRGDKVVAAVVRADQPNTAKSWLLPSSCQHCHNAACMVDCPTGAIGRDPEGEVFIRSDTCTGCGHCAKACPWENIRMAPRALDRARASQPAPGLSELLAVKCDLCRDYQAPACVEACPTGSLARLHPSQEFAEVQELLGTRTVASGAKEQHRDELAWTAARAWTLALAVALVPWAASLHASGAWRARSGLGLAAGLTAGLLLLALCAYVVPKRLIKRWMKPREHISAARRAALAAESAARAADEDRDEPGARVRSRLRPHMALHVALGFSAMGAVAVHAGIRLPASPAGAAQAAFWLAALVGAWGALVYWLLPRRLTRLERRGALPEDLAREREALLSRLFRRATGAEPRVKHALDQVLIPYASSVLGPLELFLSGRGLSAEESRVRALVRADGPSTPTTEAPRAAWIPAEVGAAAGDDLRELVRIAVEIRALPARRAATWLLRAWLPVHILSAAVLIACVLAHLMTVAW